jgi:type IV secretory pathway TraG/TraD family ATPase VirD4
LSWIEQGFPAIVYDFKYPTMSSRFAVYAKERGYEVTVFAPGCPESAICNPLDFIADQEDGLRAGQFAQTLSSTLSILSNGVAL